MLKQRSSAPPQTTDRAWTNAEHPASWRLYCCQCSSTDQSLVAQWDTCKSKSSFDGALEDNPLHSPRNKNLFIGIKMNQSTVSTFLTLGFFVWADFEKIVHRISANNGRVATCACFNKKWIFLVDLYNKTKVKYFLVLVIYKVKTITCCILNLYLESSCEHLLAWC